MQTLELSEGYALRPASVLDIPFIFDLMMNGIELHVFGSRYLFGTGSVRLLAMICGGVMAGMISHTPNQGWMILSLAGADIGFMELAGVMETRDTTLISLFAIIPFCRNAGHGSRVLRLLVDAQPTGATLLVFCNKNARAMQHMLKKLHFVRNRQGGPLEKYTLLKPGEAEAAIRPRSLEMQSGP